MLHEALRLGTPVADIAVARARCPTLPDPVPDQPVDPGGGKGDRECIDFERERFPDAARGTFGPLTAHQTAPAPGPPAVRTMSGFRGLDCGRRLEIDLPAPAAQIEATFVHFARPVKLTTLDSAGQVVGVAVATAGQRQPETLTLGAPGIARAVVEAPAGEALLLRFCFTAEVKPDPRCVTFDAVGAGTSRQSPRDEARRVPRRGSVGHAGAPREVRTLRGFTGLDCARGVQIRLSQPAPAVQLALVTLAPVVRVDAFEVDGSHAGSATVRLGGRPQMVALVGHRLAEIRIDAPRDETLLLSLCTGSRQVAEEVRRLSALARAPAEGPVAAAPANATAAGSPASMLAVAQPAGCLRYRLLLGGVHQYVRVTAAVPWMLAIALRDGKAVDGRWSTAASGVQEVTFELRSVDEAVLYTGRPVAGLTVCVDLPTTPADEEREWANVPFIAKGVQLPLREVNSALTTAADELALARSRLLPGEAIVAGDFADLSRMMNEAVAASPASPVVHSLLTRKTVDDPFLELRPWPLSLAAVADAGWRRALGFGWFDPGSLLTPGATYDYRITGHFRRRDIEEQLLAFHTVPEGTSLPPAFHLGHVHFTLPAPRAGRIHPPAPVSALRSTGRTGVPLAPTGGGYSLKLAFDQPVLSVVLELEPSAGGGLSYAAKSTDFFLGVTGTTFSGSITAVPRVTLDFASPIDTLVLRGNGLLYGVRLPEPSGGKPDDVIVRSVVLPGVRFDATSPPAPPPVLGTTNLQEPILPGDPAVTTQNPQQALGFRLHWVPPPSGGAPGPMPWPIDLGTFPPFDVLGFQIERRRVDTSGPFEEISGTTAPLTFFGNRNGRRTPDQITWGIDLLQAFPERAPAGELPDAFMTAEDVLRGPESPGGPSPGSTFQYRIYSVDAIGRRSPTATLGSVVRLEKHLAPPPPPGPPPAVPARAEAVGVRARVLQKSDPDLAPDDVTRLGASTNAIVLEWGWTTDERSRDPLASEFRIYWQPIPPDTVRGTLDGPASLVGGRWEMTATMDQPVAADALKGRYLRAPTYPFKVASNTGGELISVKLEPSELQPAATPGGAPFIVRPMLDGSELRPARWAERTTVIPIGAGAPTPYVFRDRLTVDADHPSVRVWVGVSTADAQSYVPDELPPRCSTEGGPGTRAASRRPRPKPGISGDRPSRRHRRSP